MTPLSTSQTAQLDSSIGELVHAAATQLPIARQVVEQARIAAGEQILDLGCATGNATLLASTAGACVTGVDATLRLLDIARARAAEQMLDARFLLGEPEALPISHGRIDVLVSVFGVSAAMHPTAAADEIARVLSDRGRLVLSAWIPDGATHGCAWHDRDALAVLLGPHGFEVATERHSHAGRGYVVATAYRG